MKKIFPRSRKGVRRRGVGGVVGVMSAAGCLARIPPSLWLGEEGVLPPYVKLKKLLGVLA